MIVRNLFVYNTKIIDSESGNYSSINTKIINNKLLVYNNYV